MIREITTTVTRMVELVPAAAGEQQEKHVLTVRDYSSFGRSRCPQINMTGKWLEKAGFAAGDRVQVSVEKNRLVIEKLVEENLQPGIPS